MVCTVILSTFHTGEGFDNIYISISLQSAAAERLFGIGGEMFHPEPVV